MKRALAVLLVFGLLLTFCGCELGQQTAAIGGNPASDGGIQSSADMTQAAPTALPLNEMTLKLSFGPEIELVMTEHFQCVSGRGLNEAGEALLEGIDLEGRTHYVLIREILRKAQDAGLLEMTTRLEMTADSAVPSVWTIFTKDILSVPVEHHMEDSGVLFFHMVKLPKSAPAQFHPEDYQYFTEQGDGWTNEYNMDLTTNRAKIYWTFPDSHSIEFRLSDMEYDDMVFHNDGTFEYRSVATVGTGTNSSGNKLIKLSYTTYTETAEGRYYKDYLQMLEDGTILGESFEDSEGTYYETNYNENGLCLSRSGYDAASTLYPVGSYYKETYDENGNMLTYDRWTEDGTVLTKTVYVDGFAMENYNVDTDGSFVEVTFYENRVEKSYKGSWSDGTYLEYVNNEDGTLQYRKRFDGIVETECFFDHGVMVKAIVDGVTYEDEASLQTFTEWGY